MKVFTRRDFIRGNALLVGAAIGTLGFLPFARRVDAASVYFYESNCTLQKNTGQKVLVAYASRCGSTGGVAETIGRVLCHTGANVDIKLIQHVNDINSYQTVIIGSAVCQGKWLSEAEDFVKTHRQKLMNMPVAYFLTCLTMFRPSEEDRQKSLSYLNQIRQEVPEIKPVNIGLFAGALDYSKLSIITRTVMKSKMEKKGISEGDYRNWKSIRQWADDVSLAFTAKQQMKAT